MTGRRAYRNLWTVAVCGGRLILTLMLLLVMLTMSGCQLASTRESAQAQEPQAGPSEPELEPAPNPDISTAMKHLEAGRGEAARRVLATLAKRRPGSGVIEKLLRQIDQPPEQLLPGPYRLVAVGSGESLSLIAARELGDPLMFYALARLNGIEMPALVPVGTMLRVPEEMNAGRDQGIDGEITHAIDSDDNNDVNSDRPSTVAVEVLSEDSIKEVESIAEYLARSGRNDQARALLIGKLGDGGGAESTRELLAGLTLERTAELRGEGALARAVEVIDETLEVMGASGRRAGLVEQRDEIRLTMLREEVLRLRARGELAEAYRAAHTAANLETASKETALFADGLRAELVDSLHNDALVAWRDRNVDLAIRTWESLLEVAPDFEPARVYLERARRLRERLDQP